MIDLKSKIEGFSKVYRIETQNYSKIIKVYNQRAFINYFRVNLKKFSKFYSSIQKLKIAPFHRVLSNHILEINEVKCDYPLNNKIFFNNKRLLTQFKEQILLINKVNKKLIDRNLIDEIKNYLKVTKSNKFIKNKIKKLEDYINKYPQNRICHGDIHFDNLVVSKQKLILIDWDYSIRSGLGYELAMFAYLEKFNKKQIKHLSKIFEVSKNEIEHYLPICKLLDYLYQDISYKLNSNKKIDKTLIKKNKDFILNIL